VARSSPDDPAAAVAAALAPYAWREFNDRTIARRAVGALDRHLVVGFLAGLPGTEVGVVGAVEPGDADDARVDALVGALDGRQWRAWSMARLCATLLSALEKWQAERESPESDLRRLLEGR
jgi:hypothetical protein